jgi:hypothetical protein
MAQTNRRRRRKRRGTQGGRIDTRPSRGRPRSRQEARDRARARRSGGKPRGGKQRRTPDRRDQPPTWSGAVTRALFAAAIFLVSILLIFKQPVVSAVPLAALMLAIYIPLGHAIDGFIYNRRQAAKRRAPDER